MIHHERHGGISAIDIDHHNPTLPDSTRNSYENLFLASRHCNGKKSDKWPSAELQEKGIRFLNPCLEQDYGNHLFEDPDTFELWSETPAGKYHIRMLDLNAPHLVRERKVRARLHVLKNEPALVTPAASSGENVTAIHAAILAFLQELELMIPLIPQKTQPAVGATA